MEDVVQTLKHWQLLLPCGGEGSVALGDMVFPFVKNAVFLCSGEIKPRVSGLFPPDYLLYSFDLPFVGKTGQTDLSPLLSRSVTAMFLEEERYAQFLGLVEDIPVNDGSFGADWKRMMGFFSVILFLCPVALEESAGAYGKVKQRSPRIEPILLYIAENLSEPLCLEQIATQFFISKTYLCRLFKASTGLSVMDYIIKERIALACDLLQHGYSVQNVGEMAGFSDNSHFIRTFRKIQGVSPGKYGKAVLGGYGKD